MLNARFSRLLYGVVVSLVIGAAAFSEAQSKRQEQSADYRGKAVTTTALLCRSDQIATAGFWGVTGATRQSASIGRESKVTTWRIELNKTLATVITYAGATQTLDSPRTFTVEQTGAGWLLVSRRLAGESPEIITINASDSSFVYSTQHINGLFNRANIFYGACDPAS